MTDTATQTTTPAINELLRGWTISLRAANRADRTVILYTDSVKKLIRYLITKGMPSDPLHINREHLEAYMADLTVAPSSKEREYKQLQQFWKWLIREGEIKVSPMLNMIAPQVPDNDPAVLTEPKVRAVIKACEGQDFQSRRDMAIIRLLIDSGLRRAELKGLQMTDIDWDESTVHVTGKRQKERDVPFGRRTAEALSRYVRMRSRHNQSHLPDLWIGQRGALTLNGVYQVVRDRSLQAGIGKAWTHLFRHSWANLWLSGGGQEGDLMRLAGWTSESMVRKYGRSAAGSRAKAAHKSFGPGDRL